MMEDKPRRSQLIMVLYSVSGKSEEVDGTMGLVEVWGWFIIIIIILFWFEWMYVCKVSGMASHGRNYVECVFGIRKELAFGGCAEMTFVEWYMCICVCVCIFCRKSG